MNKTKIFLLRACEVIWGPVMFLLVVMIFVMLGLIKSGYANYGIICFFGWFIFTLIITVLAEESEKLRRKRVEQFNSNNMKVLTAELVASNKRERITGGVYIEFESSENVVKDDYFKVNVDGFDYDFQAKEVKVEGENLKVRAIEVGYWAQKFGEKGIDLRTAIGCEIIAVTDDAEKAKINERSCWC